ncbi:Hypothetical_protein [Hexamita inflata]|uniref:Hypothetical_protein n=1 Tax=Hexamita inflata TaxID=28002 RepID=A0AA86QEV6_9EUKA|nr:Hypothetical protein HINF_LOCUS45035 [Hexamita inflata]
MPQSFNVKYKSYVGALLKLKFVHLFRIKHYTDIWSMNFTSLTLVSLMISSLLQFTYDLNLFGNSESYFNIASNQSDLVFFEAIQALKASRDNEELVSVKQAYRLASVGTLYSLTQS